MPIGPYENFSACVAAQKRKGRSDESAKKICGEIEKRAKKSNGEIDVDEIERCIVVQEWADNILKK